MVIGIWLCVYEILFCLVYIGIWLCILDIGDDPREFGISTQNHPTVLLTDCSPRFWHVDVWLFYELVFCSVYWYLVVCVTVGQTNVLMFSRLTHKRYGEAHGGGTTRPCWIAACHCQSLRRRASTSTSSHVWQRAILSTSRCRTKPLFYQLRSLNVFDTNDRNSLVFMYKEFQNLLPTNLLSYLKKSE